MYNGAPTGLTYRKKYYTPYVFADLADWNLTYQLRLFLFCFKNAKISDGFMSDDIKEIMNMHSVKPQDVSHVYISMGFNDEKQRRFQKRIHALSYAKSTVDKMSNYLISVSHMFRTSQITWLGCGYVHRYRNGYPTFLFHLRNIHTHADATINNSNSNVHFYNIYKTFEDRDVDRNSDLTETGGLKIIQEIKQLILK